MTQLLDITFSLYSAVILDFVGTHSVEVIIAIAIVVAHVVISIIQDSKDWKKK